MATPHPAYHIHLTNQQKRLIADISAMQSQIEWLIRLTVQELLEVPPDLARTIVGSTSMQSNSEIWIKTIRAKQAAQSSIPWAEWALKELQALVAKRNGFLHTLFGHDSTGQSQGPISFIIGKPSTRVRRAVTAAAIKVKNTQPVDLDELAEIHRRLAFLTKVYAHINWTLSHPSEPSPWRRTLAAVSRVHLGSAQSPSATKHGARPKTSRP